MFLCTRLMEWGVSMTLKDEAAAIVATIPNDERRESSVDWREDDREIEQIDDLHLKDSLASSCKTQYQLPPMPLTSWPTTNNAGVDTGDDNHRHCQLGMGLISISQQTTPPSPSLMPIDPCFNRMDALAPPPQPLKMPARAA